MLYCLSKVHTYPNPDVSLSHRGFWKKEGEIIDDAKLTPEELEEMEKQFWEIVRKYRPEISEEKNLIQNNKIYAKDCAYGLTLLHSCEYTVCVEGKPL